MILCIALELNLQINLIAFPLVLRIQCKTGAVCYGFLGLFIRHSKSGSQYYRR